MSQEFIKLEQDDDIVMLEKDVFTVARLKELLSENIKQMIEQKSGDRSIADLFYNRKISITDKSITFNLSCFALIFPPDYLDCQLFNLNLKKWVDIKLRVIANVNIEQWSSGYRNSERITTVKVDLEYSYPDNDPIKLDSTDETLDDLRAKLNQINPS